MESLGGRKEKKKNKQANSIYDAKCKQNVNTFCVTSCKAKFVGAPVLCVTKPTGISHKCWRKKMCITKRCSSAWISVAAVKVGGSPLSGITTSPEREFQPCSNTSNSHESVCTTSNQKSFAICQRAASKAQSNSICQMANLLALAWNRSSKETLLASQEAQHGSIYLSRAQATQWPKLCFLDWPTTANG